MKTTYEERKFTELLVHVASRLQSDRSGRLTKLNKVLFLADSAHVRRTGSPITGAGRRWPGLDADVATTRARGRRAARSHRDVIGRVDVAPAAYESANERFGESRSAGGDGSEYDFVGGPLAAAVYAFRDFDALSYDLVPAVPSYTVVDPILGAVTFAAAFGSNPPDAAAQSAWWDDRGSRRNRDV